MLAGMHVGGQHGEMAGAGRVKGVVPKSSEDREIGLCEQRRVILIVSFEHASGKLDLAGRSRVRLRRNGNRHSLENRHRRRRRRISAPPAGVRITLQPTVNPTP